MLAARKDFPEPESLIKGRDESVGGQGPAIELQRLLRQRVEQERDMAGVIWLSPPSTVGPKPGLADMVDPLARVGSRILGPLALFCAVGGLLTLVIQAALLIKLL